MKIRKIVQIDKLIIGATLAFLGVSCGNVYSAIDAGALPTGGVVVGGTGTEFTTVGNNMTVNIAGSGDRVIINYDTFNIGSDASVTFQQAATNSVVLNRVPGATVASEIMGALSANGNVYIVNPAGVIFGANATINVGNLIAAAGNITDENFLAGTDKFSLSGTLENQANISAGNIALLGKIVKNSGTITSSGKTIVMASGDEVTLTDAGTGISVNVTNTVAETTNAGVENSGTLDAGDTGSVIIGAGDLYSLAIVNNGIIKGGKVDLNAGASSGNGKIEGSASSSIEANDLNISGGNVTQTGVVKADTATVSGTDVVLNNANNELGTVNVTASNDATITDKDAVAVNGTVVNNLTVTAGDKATVSGSADTVSVQGTSVEFGATTATTLSATASAGNVTQTGAVVADTATLSATDVVLNNANNELGTVNVTALNDATITDADAVAVNASVVNNLTVTAGDKATVSGSAKTVSAQGTSVEFGATTATTLSATATGGNVTQTGAVIADTATVSGTDVVLSNANNELGTVNVTASNDAIITDKDALAVNASVVNNLAVTAGDKATVSGSADTVSAQGTSVEFGVTTATTLSATATAGNVTQTGAVIADTATVSGTDVTLDNANNELGTVNVTASNDATITDKDAVAVNASVVNNLAVTAGDKATVSGSADTLSVQGTSVEFGATTATTLSATATAGNVTQTGPVVADTATVSGTDVVLDNANNELGTVNVTASNDATITDKDAVAVSGSANNLAVTAGDVEFGATTATTLSATASAGNVTQTGAVVADTATLSATDILLNNANNDFNTANVDATNDVKLTDADDINFNTVKGNVEITAKSVVFNQDVDTNSLTVNAEKLVLQNVTTQKDQVYNVNKNPDPTDLSKESAPITIKGTKLESVEGKINLGSDVVGGNPENPSIYAENALAITAKNFEMGKAQKMLVNGNVDITATDSATLSDIFTHATLKVSAENINIKWRDITTYTDQTTGKTYNDNGVGFIADTFDFAPNAKISKVGSGSGEFASFEFSNDNDTIKVLNGTSFAQPLDSNRNPDGKLVASNFVDGNTFVYGIVPTGVPPTDVAKFLAGASPNVEALDIPEESVSAAMRENLVKIGIYARANTEIEKVDSFNGMVQYFEIVTSENPQPSDYKVAEGRIDSTRAEIVLNMSNEIFWQKDGENIKSNVADIRNDITKAYEKYVNNVGKSSATAEGFARFIEEDEDKYAKKALQRIKSFRQLFKEIERLGLTPVELDISKNVLLRPIRVRGLNSATLKKVIEHEVSVELTEKTTENQQTTASL